MFQNLKDNLLNTLDKLRSKGLLTEQDVDNAMREIRIALLGADVALPVVKQFTEQVKQKAIGQEVLKSINPGQMVTKIVSDELTALLGSENQDLKLKSLFSVVMLVGLQGAGKTTTAAKLATYLRKKYKKKPYMASLDIYRPAAQQQLEILAKQLDIPILPIVADEKPETITKRALKEAKIANCDVLILDTAGRLHTDQTMIDELKQIKSLTKPDEILLVADAMTGHDAVNISSEFNAALNLTGIILTRVDGDARGGAALSMKSTVGCPIKFIGVGEKSSDLEPFYPDRMAARILDKGDVVSLVEQASEIISEKEADKLAQKLSKGKFDMNDLLTQLRNLRKMGGASKLLNYMPGMSGIKEKLQNIPMDDKVFKKQEAIISSMTLKERKDPSIINASRKKRIASGAGVAVSDVNQLINRYRDMLTMFRRFNGQGTIKKFKGLF